MRDSFERSLGVIDQAVVNSLDELKTNPHDEVSEEMLNSALRDRMDCSGSSTSSEEVASLSHKTAPPHRALSRRRGSGARRGELS